MSLLNVQNLVVHFPIKRGRFIRGRHLLRAVNDISFTIQAGETVGLVGESGCGKTTTGKAIVRLLTPTAGNVLFEGEAITRFTGEELRRKRRGFQMIFQDPFTSLNPNMKISQIIGEAIDAHKLAHGAKARKKRIESLLESVGLEPTYADRYPREFSGGQRQRIGIARSLAVEPKLIVCDEPVSALDVSVQAQIVNLLHDLQRERGLAYLFVAHDLALVEHISQRMLVMYLGKIVEAAESSTLIRMPRHPYTRALISAVPTIEPNTKVRKIVLPGELPSPISPPPGCPFHPRCPIAEPRCRVEPPALREVSQNHFVSCHLA